MIKLTFYSDPGHGWLRVKREVLKTLGLEDDISNYSYQKESWAYLEEDRDAGILLDTLSSTNKGFEIKEVNSNSQSKIRSYCPFVPHSA